jgi:NAD(P)-dependent dehydrogenase (short-subunit alcohol dehydrogenase family)
LNQHELGGLIAGGGALYGATKFAVVGLSENVYLQLQREGLKPRVSVLCPGFVDTNILYSDRNRPAEFGDASAPQTDPAANAIRERAAAELKKSGLSPSAVGEHVLAAIRDERFYILTHPELNPVIEQRMQDILSGNNPAVVPSPELMQKLNALRPS